MAEKKKYEYRGRLVSKAEVARISGYPWHVVQQRLDTYHWSVEKTINTPMRRVKSKRKTEKQDVCRRKKRDECLNCELPKCLLDDIPDD